MAQARALLAERLGPAVADKATAEFAVVASQRLEGNEPRPATVVADPVRGTPPSPSPAVVQFALPPLDDPETSTTPTAGPARDEAVAAARRAALEVLRPHLRALGIEHSDSDSGESDDVCWLNGTVRSSVPLERLAEVARDPAVVALAVPQATTLSRQRYQPNYDTVGLPAFRADTGLTGRGVVVAVIDSEVAVHHPAFGGRAVQRLNLTAERWNLPDDHGTAVAGIVAADDVVYGGVAPEAAVHNYKAFDQRGDGDDFGCARALAAAVADGAMVANCSFRFDEPGGDHRLLTLAVDRAWSLGLVVVAAAGNAGQAGPPTGAPADASGVIVVGATDVAGTKVAPYSSWGPIGGWPGPHLVAPGGINAEVPLAGCLANLRFGRLFDDGTSYATPHVTGMVALLAQAFGRTWSPSRYRLHLLATARLLPGVPKRAQGFGLLRCVVPRPAPNDPPQRTPTQQSRL
ncbi:MAG TPA: S8 family serine peptidase [Acidimicrobiales bacterium]|nr:S8 family serine peptidase [Acidimicrobiales bacterium]